MAERGLRALEAKNYVPRTSDGKADKPSPNRLLNAVIPTAPETVWAGDITFIPTTAGWLYLAVVIDLCSRRILAWSTADNLRADLVADAFQQAVKSRRPKPGLVFHSDRGSQYGSKLFRGQLEKAEALQGISAKANPYDNVWTEPTAGRSTAAGCLKGESSELIFYRKAQSRDASGRMLH